MAGRVRVAAGYAVSAVLHLGLFAALLSVRPAPVQRAEPVEVEIVEREKLPPPPPPEPAPEPPRPLEPERAKPAPPPPPAPKKPVRVAKPPPRPKREPPREDRPPPPPDAPPPPPGTEDLPPPPNSAAPPGEAKPGPIRYGVSMGSTTTAGGAAAPVGNSLYGRPAERAGDPAEARPYRAEKYAPPTQVATLPSCTCEVPKSEYPARAAREGREGQVKLRLLVSAEGEVTEATVLSDPGFGFGQAAARSARRFCRCEPATRGGEKVSTELSPFTFTFQLP